MKISKIFHSLYFMVMFLPLFIIPIFAININQKSVEPISIEVQENKQVIFNQLVSDDKTTFNWESTSHSVDWTTLNFVVNHKYYLRFEPTIQYPMNPKYYQFYMTGGNLPSTQYDLHNTIYQYNIDVSDVHLMYMEYEINGTYIRYSGYINQFDLTLMFGEGNEPTPQEFDTIFYESNYEYTLGRKVLIPNVTTTYDNTDIGSQFIYSLYKPVHDYFNFGQYLGLNGIYDWFQVNFFNGTAPLPFFIFFNLMIYWLIISLFWLIFDVLIYVPMVIHRWLDKGALE